MIMLIVLGLLSFLILGLTYHEMAKVLLTHVPADTQQPEDFGLAGEKVFLGEKGRRIAAWYVPINSPKGGVVLVHGLGLPNGGKAQMLVHAAYLQKAGWSTLVIDMYSFGESEGKKITLGSDEWQDVAAGYQFIRSQPDLKAKPVGLLGISMGGSSVIIAAGKENIGDFVITSAAYPSIKQLLTQQLNLRGFNQHLFFYPTQWIGKILTWPQRDAVDFVNKITVPLLMIHGVSDERVPYKEALVFKDKAGKNLQWFEVKAGHDIHAERPIEFQEIVLSFLNRQQSGD